jgi:hypothetical protein
VLPQKGAWRSLFLPVVRTGKEKPAIHGRTVDEVPPIQAAKAKTGHPWPDSSLKACFV